LIASTPFSSFASIRAEERILFYEKTSSNDKIRLGLLTMSSRTFDFIIAMYSIIKFQPTSSVNKGAF
jgi:hypothetical protein